ncbi:MAG: IS3 family transposase [Elusimicrobia bacterium]|nr:IS3 family transposase [Elusimicrobiota bacterium]
MDLMCRALDVSRSGYYWRRGAAVSSREQENQVLLNQIKEIFENSRRTYGSPRVTEEMQERGFRCGRHRVARLMRRAGIQAKVKNRFRAKRHKGRGLWACQTSFSGSFPRPRPTGFGLRTLRISGRGRLDLFGGDPGRLFPQDRGMVPGRRPTTELARAAFERALGQRKGEPGLVHHSDQGAQYANHEYQALLKAKGIDGSMGDKGTCYDNAMMESFFHTLKTEHTYWQSYGSREEAEHSLFDYIELFYIAERRHSGVGYKSPSAFEKQNS